MQQPTDAELSEAVLLLRNLSRGFAASRHPASAEAHHTLVAAQRYVAALAIAAREHDNLPAAIEAALDGFRSR